MRVCNSCQVYTSGFTGCYKTEKIFQEVIQGASVRNPISFIAESM